MKIGIYTVAVNDYLPELIAITIPSIKRYAQKIGASFTFINERKYPNLPPTYEKLQVYDLGKENNYNILFDADMVLHEKMYNPIPCLIPGCIGAWMQYDAHFVLNHDDLIGPRHIMVSTNCLIVPIEYHDIWKPFGNPEKMIKNMKRPFCLDEYCISRNRISMGVGLCPVMTPDMEGITFRHSNINTKPKNISEEIISIKEFLSRS